MDGKSLMNVYKCKMQQNKRGKGEEGKVNKGSISIWDLPEEILFQEILSKLPMKQAVRTSVLSKKWIDKWLNMSKIELREFRPDRRQKFIDFVERVLVTCNGLQLHPSKFCLQFEVCEEDIAMLNRWHSGFIKPNIQELTLNYLDSLLEPFVFPDHLFTSPKLTKLDLNTQRVLNLPSTIYLKSLKSLILDNVLFPDTSQTQNLFSGIPFLEELYLTDCGWWDVTNVSINCPLLHKLIIKEWKGQNGDHNIAPNRCRIMIFAPDLKTFYYDGHPHNDYFLCDSKSVVDGAVVAYPLEYSWNATYVIFKLLIVLANAKTLAISNAVVEAMSPVHYNLITRLPFFQNLVNLRVESLYGVEFSNSILLAILRNSPHLRELEFTRVSLTPNGADSIGQIPTCFEKHLKWITIRHFFDKQEELDAIKYLLQKATVLDTLHVSFAMIDLDFNGRLAELFDIIEDFPRASEKCKVKIDIHYEGVGDSEEEDVEEEDDEEEEDPDEEVEDADEE